MSDAFFSALAERFRELEQPLNALDAATGDGDHGAAMRRGLEAVAAADPGTAAQAFRGAAGGASGTPFGALVGGLEATLAGDRDLPSALAHAAGQVAKLGMAKRGDKTMLDALIPAAEAAGAVPSGDAAQAAFTWLEETDDLPVASEGDALGAVTQIVARALSGRVGYLLDMTEPDLDAGQLLMWHGGGGPLYLADDAGARWVNHPMIGRGTEQGPIYGAIADLVFRDGPVTVFRVARDAGALFEMTAESHRRDPSGFTGCRGWLDSFRIAGEAASLEEVVASVMSHGLEHHFVLVPGDEAAALEEFASLTGMQRLGRRPMRTHLSIADFS